MSVYIIFARVLQKIYSEKRIAGSRGMFTSNSIDIQGNFLSTHSVFAMLLPTLDNIGVFKMLPIW